jgi:hypothetical protein
MSHRQEEIFHMDSQKKTLQYGLLPDAIPRMLKYDWNISLTERESDIVKTIFIWRYAIYGEEHKSFAVNQIFPAHAPKATRGYRDGKLSFSLNINQVTVMVLLTKMLGNLTEPIADLSCGGLILSEAPTVLEFFRNVCKITTYKKHFQCVFWHIVQKTKNNGKTPVTVGEILDICKQYTECPLKHEVLSCDYRRSEQYANCTVEIEAIQEVFENLCTDEAIRKEHDKYYIN